jgi:uncharacterized protein
MNEVHPSIYSSTIQMKQELQPLSADKPSVLVRKGHWFGVKTKVLVPALLFIFSLIGLGAYLSDWTVLGWWELVSTNVSSEIFIFILAGFIAQMIDGALGMAYGVSASTFLLSFGVPPAAISASIHTSEIFTSGASGLMHLKFKNVNRLLFRSLLLPGIAGAILGAYVLSSLEEYNHYLKPVIAIYTLILGILIIRKALRGKGKKKVKRIAPLALFGGFMDSVGGGGWGPIVSSSLIAGGRHPRYTVGSVNLAEFFVALASALTFFTLIGISHWQIIAGLIIGGVIAAPIAANLSRKLPVKTMLLLVGAVVILVSLRILVLAIL